VIRVATRAEDLGFDSFMQAKGAYYGAMKSHTRSTAGFTLIELMITVTIVAILAAIAYPSYRSYVLRGQVVNATNGLTAMAANMERYYQDNRTYSGTSGGLTPPCTTPTTYGSFTVSCPATLSNAPATFTAAQGATNAVQATSTFQLEAIGSSTSSGNTAGFYYFIDQAGNQGTTVTAPAPSGWIITCTSSWEMKAGTC
jgi:type IV pilus assembly protein PilE